VCKPIPELENLPHKVPQHQHKKTLTGRDCATIPLAEMTTQLQGVFIFVIKLAFKIVFCMKKTSNYVF
jgi:hypothetical protein